jgi:LemA protein
MVGLPVLILLGLVLLFFVVGIGLYNGLVSTRNQCDEAWSNVDTELKRRYDLIPNLVSTVKGYAAHERELIEQVVTMRERAVAGHGTLAEHAADEQRLQQSLGTLMARLEAYPDLKASANFLELQKELANTEDRIQAALRFYNGNIRENNNRVMQFPSNVVAGMFNFGSREFFELDVPAARQPVEVKF